MLVNAVTLKQNCRLAAEFAKGVVKEVDVKAGKVTIIHEELVNLEMPAMMTVFDAADVAILERMKVGETIALV